ncbi:cohesin-loading factor complex subunit SCC4 KNAG_0G01620 [Huiozyma naganishii CBS 8797]|uniref:Uncharacterized protein n=1 Tax=Huiozyma naganishii (strain ATCC MYA-139 / BCRC 22969 / CBS 8797 / KCTC 17520 / NBRC 10181 / NCYC 3082 / Yp74L-3) TaxID=1071383 RepID=J7R8M3_HUIN7|nr:hypothetical protein KNAG_0G01620 [Kazachstania naganishii CBS 8797]CCK71220.1 hypothetical protein KNAG_0G01620 [Kazachstania naganishii CBS 8797]
MELYGVAVEYETLAFELAQEMLAEGSSEVSLVQYYRLIEMAVRTLVALKQRGTLSLEQDCDVTWRLARLLVNETWDLDLAETYLSSLRERIISNGRFIDNLNARLVCEYWLLYEIPLRRDDKFHCKIALRGCFALLEGLDTKSNMYSLFKFIAAALNLKMKKYRRAQLQLEELVLIIEEHDASRRDWYAFVLLRYVNLMLERRTPLTPATKQRLAALKCDEIGPQLYVWKLFLELTIQIYKDANITDELNKFKTFFQSYKTELKTADRYSIKFNEFISMQVQLSTISQYRDVKNVLLLMQSVSYLVNCYDPRANFSTKFLPKVKATTGQLIKTMADGAMPQSLSHWDTKSAWYNDILYYCDFYTMWEHMLLGSSIETQQPKDTKFWIYNELLNAINGQSGLSDCEGASDCLAKYSAVLAKGQSAKRSAPNEVKIICLLNQFTVLASQVSQNEGVQDGITQCGEKWAQIAELMRETDLEGNNVWDCTIAIVWIISHFEPFTWNPLPSTNEEKSVYMNKLNEYYSANKMVNMEHAVAGGERFQLKKSLLLQILLNYLGGRIIETETELITEISATCFKLARRHNMAAISYVVGLWHLMNCTISMKPKEVTYTTAKLEAIVREMKA